MDFFNRLFQITERAGKIESLTLDVETEAPAGSLGINSVVSDALVIPTIISSHRAYIKDTSTRYFGRNG